MTLMNSRWLPQLLLLVQLNQQAFSQNPTLASSLSSECISFISSYPPTVSLYASQICKVCQGLGLAPSVEPCCSTSNPTACFASSFYGKTVSDATVSNPITKSYSSDLASTNCDSVISIFEQCQASTPGFENLCFHNQQSCLCSTSSTWAPSIYDNYWSSCLEWAQTADPSEYSVIEPGPTSAVQSRKCQTWAQLTATGGTHSNCLTSPSNTLTSTSSQSGGPLTATSTSKGAARENSEIVLGNRVIVVINLIYVYFVV